MQLKYVLISGALASMDATQYSHKRERKREREIVYFWRWVIDLGMENHISLKIRGSPNASRRGGGQ